TAVGENAVLLEWQDNSDDEDSFILEYRRATTDWQALNPSLQANHHAAQINNLPLGVTFFFQVKAHNSDGDSPYSNEVAFRAGPLPGLLMEEMSGASRA